jgi:hypothetical protein
MYLRVQVAGREGGARGEEEEEGLQVMARAREREWMLIMRRVCALLLQASVIYNIIMIRYNCISIRACKSRSERG